MEEHDEFEEIERQFLRATNMEKVLESNPKVQELIKEKENTELKTGDYVSFNSSSFNYSISGIQNFVYYSNNNYNNTTIRALTRENRIGKIQSSHSNKDYLYVDVIVPELNSVPTHIVRMTIAKKAMSKIDGASFNSIVNDAKFMQNIESYDAEHLLSLVNTRNIRYNKEQREKVEREKKVTENINLIKSIAEDIHGENYDFDLVKSNEFTPDSTYIYRLTIKFPEFTIKNSRNKEHKIIDFYISIFFNKDFYARSTLYGKRGKLTLEEYESRYGHSHMNTSAAFGWQNLCLGSGTELAYSVANLGSSGFSAKELTKTLLLFHSYVTWESLEGTPYCNLEGISRKQDIRLSTFHDSTLLTEYNKFIIYLRDNSLKLPIKLSQINNYSTFIIDSNELEKLLLPNTPMAFKAKKASDGTYIPISSDYENRMQRIRNGNNSISSANQGSKYAITFKGETFDTKIIDESSNNDLEVVPNPQLTKYILDTLQKNINNYHLTNTKYELSSM